MAWIALINPNIIKISCNQVFDVLVANPPYSVSGFKGTVKHGSDSFELYADLTDKSSEIECLFIERTKQLIKEGGYAGIILPSSILSNGGVYAKARKILLECFEVYAICEFGANTFVATGTNTIILFMKRRDETAINGIKEAIKRFMVDHQDVTVNGIETPFSSYAKDVYQLEFVDYVAMLTGDNQDIEAYQDYKKANKDIIQEEIEKLALYILNADVQTLLIKSGEKKIEKEFLGYEFSNRRGSEGIKIYQDDDGNPSNKLYNANDRHDRTRVSSYIYQAGLSKNKLEVDESLANHLSYQRFVDMINFQTTNFEREVS
jgi:type I restriction enzyme M protein